MKAQRQTCRTASTVLGLRGSVGILMRKKSVAFAVSVLLAMGFAVPAASAPKADPPGNSASAPGQIASAPSFQVPGQGRDAGKEIVAEIGVPDFVGLPPALDSTPQPTRPGNSENAPPTPNVPAVPGTPSAPNFPAIPSPGAPVSSPGNSGNTPAANPGVGVGAGLADLTPPGLVRRLDTPAAAKAKFADSVPTECTEVIDGGSADGCLPQNYLIQYRVGADLDAESRGLASRLVANFKGVMPGLAATLTAVELAELAQFSTVLGIELDQTIRVRATQVDPVWGLDRLDQISTTPDSRYNYEQTGLGVAVYVVDTGVRGTHQDFSGRVAEGFSAVSDGPGNQDCNGHGTHVAGTIGGETYGVAKDVSIIPVRVLGCDGSGTLSGVISGLSWIGQVHDGTPAVVNMSLGGGASASMDAAVEGLLARGIHVVVAAGNASSDACNFSPARVPGALTVAASTIQDELASYSNFGSCVDLIAPGSSIRSAYHTSNSAVATLSGTSMAAPHVSGVVAQALEVQNDVPANIAQTVISSATAGAISEDLKGTVNLLAHVNLTDSNATVPTEETEGTPGPDSPDEPSDESKVNIAPLAASRASVSLKGTSPLISWRVPSEFAASLTKQYMRIYAFGEFIAELELEPQIRELKLEGLEYGLGYAVTLVLENEFGRSPESLQSDTFRQRPPQKPTDGEFIAWTKKVSDTEVKFYVKYPQLGQKIQFMVQQRNGEYRELAWLRITQSDLDSEGNYANLTNSIYFVRSVFLAPGKNRLRVLVDGELVGQTRTYSK